MIIQHQSRKLNGSMKKTHLKYIFKSIKDDLSRLIAITVIVLLSIGFLTGLMGSPKDLRASFNKYYEETNLLDIYIQSTIGFSKDDIDFLKENVDGIDKIEDYYQVDEYVYLDSTRIQGRVIYREFNEDSIDKLTLVEGTLPASSTECVMLNPKNSMVNYSVGDIVTINETNYTIVGKVNDPFYISNQPETTTIGNGVLDGVIYFDKSFISDYEVTMIKITFKESNNYSSYDSKYTNFINTKVDEISNLSLSRLEIRKEEIKEQFIEQAVIEAKEELREQIISFVPSLEGTTTLDSIIEYIVSTEMFQQNVATAVEEAFNEFIGNNPLKWYVLTRNEIPSYYMANVDVGKIDTISQILPVFFFLIALLVSLSSITRIIQKDRPQIGTFKSLGYSKGTIFEKYVIYGLLSTLIGCIVGATLGTFILPYVIMQIYRSLYDIPILVFVFDYSNVLLYSSIMIILILLCILLVAFSALKEHVSTLFSGKAPTAGKKILLERITFLWKHLSFKQKSMLRNVFRFKKNLIMMLIGIGGCTGILLTSFGLKDSLSVIQTTQYNEIIKYDLIVSVNDINDNPINEQSESEPIYYLTGEVLSQNENIDVSILSSNNLTNYVNLFDNDFNENSIIVTNQIADQLNLKVGENIVVDCPSQNIFVQLRVSGITTNYINNYIYLGEKAFKNYFGDLTKNAFLVKNDMTSDELTSYTRELLLNNNVTSVSSTSDIAYTYENILNNLNSIVAILVLLSGALIAVVIYNLTDIIITERIKEIATLRVTGYTRRESLLYIFREIIFMTILGICLGLVIGVFLHRYVMINITSIGLCFGESIAPLSYLYTIILALGFMIITTTCFYPKIKKIQMAEALKSVE